MHMKTKDILSNYFLVFLTEVGILKKIWKPKLMNVKSYNISVQRSNNICYLFEWKVKHEPEYVIFFRWHYFIFSHKFFPLQVIFLLARHLLCMYLFPLSDKVIRWEDDLGGGQISRHLSDIYITISIELAMRKNAAAGVTGRD